MSINSVLTRRSGIVALGALMVLVTACSSSSEGWDIASVGLAIEADIQPGATFEVAVPKTADTIVSVASSPRGVDATITPGPDADTMLLRLAVAEDTPRGAYNLTLQVIQDGAEYELGWPFEVTDPVGPLATTVPSSVEALLVVEAPQPGDLFATQSVIEGRSSETTVGYRLIAGDSVVAEGATPVVAGVFRVEVEFVNRCCIEMILEVFHPGDNGLAVTIPLTYPESGVAR